MWFEVEVLPQSKYQVAWADSYDGPEPDNPYTSDVKLFAYKLDASPYPEFGDSGVDRITATWSAPLSSGASAITRYVIKYKKSADSTYLEQFVAANTAIDGVFTLVINGIDPGPQYTVQISAENNFGEGIPVSQTIDGTDLPPEEPPAPPDPYDFGQMTFNGACLT